jgi:hypothetical protein
VDRPMGTSRHSRRKNHLKCPGCGGPTTGLRLPVATHPRRLPRAPGRCPGAGSLPRNTGTGSAGTRDAPSNLQSRRRTGRRTGFTCRPDSTFATLHRRVPAAHGRMMGSWLSASCSGGWSNGAFSVERLRGRLCGHGRGRLLPATRLCPARQQPAARWWRSSGGRAG